MGKYVCKDCGLVGDDEQFGIKQRRVLASGVTKEYVNTRCLGCANKRANQLRVERYPHAWIRNRYNIDDATARYWYERSSTSCEICGKFWVEGKERLCIDHDHTTGKIRGILCKHCNHVLGHSREQISILENAKSYLLSHREN